MKETRIKKLVHARRASQLLFLGLFIYILWSTTYPLTGTISSRMLFKNDPLIMVMTALSERVFISGLIFALLMLVATLVLGRFFCGWICPLGTMIDWCGHTRQKKNGLPERTNTKLRKLKLFVLGAVFLLAMWGMQIAWVFDPLVIVGRAVSLNVIPAVTLAIDKVWIAVIQRFELYGSVYDAYQEMKRSLLGVKVSFFANSVLSFLLFVVIAGISFFLARAWCRILCPLGGLYSVFARWPWLRRKVETCVSCQKCHQLCRMGAIKEDFSYDPSECVLCMDCVYDCNGATRFSFQKPSSTIPAVDNKGISRRDFLFLMTSSLLMMGSGTQKAFADGSTPSVIRPPGAQDEKRFLNSCVRCGNCMKVCPTNGLQPVMLESGMQGLWTPQLVPEIGYCEYNCTLCGNVCPTDAIPSLEIEDKKKRALGTAVIDHSICLAWNHHELCIVCEEHCPVANKAIKIQESFVNGQRIPLPVVDEKLCIGCGICQNKCPVRPVRAIRVKG